MTAMQLKRYPSSSGGFALGKMGVGATMLKQGKTARDYVQNGLIAMWDGIENAGWGVHDANATVWKDLIGDGDFAVGSRSFSANGLLWSNVSALEWTPNCITGESFWNGDFTIQMGGKFSSTTYQGPGLYGQQSTSITQNTYGTAPNRYIYSNFRSFNVTSWSVFGRVNEDDGVFPDEELNWSASIRGNYVQPYVGGDVVGYNRNITRGAYSTGFMKVRWSGRAGCHLDFVRIYTRALTAAEIAANYRIDKERFNLP